MIDQVALDADRLLGGSPDTGLIIDETGIPKKGEMSVGAARQWCGRLGKVDNCQVGVMDHYQIRGWLAWHHHMAMVMMSMLFTLETRQEQKEQYPLLSCPDIAILLAYFLPRRDVNPEEVLRQMAVRHRQRQASIDSAYARQGANVTK